MPCGEPSGLQKMNSVEGHEETPQDGGILRWEGHSPEGVLKFRLRFSTGYEEKPPERGERETEKEMGASAVGSCRRNVKEGLVEVRWCRAGGRELVQLPIDRSPLVSCRQCYCGPPLCSQHQRTGLTCRAQCTASWWCCSAAWLPGSCPTSCTGSTTCCRTVAWILAPSTNEWNTLPASPKSP